MKKDLMHYSSLLLSLYLGGLISGCGSSQVPSKINTSLKNNNSALNGQSESIESTERVTTQLDQELSIEREKGIAVDVTDPGQMDQEGLEESGSASSKDPQISAIPPWGQSGVVMDTSVLWKTPSADVYSYNHYTPLVHYRGGTYFVWRDAQGRPWVTKIKNGQAEIVPLDPNTDYKAIPDGHNRFSMGIDRDGYIHISGDMHNYTFATTESNGIPYPARYQKQGMLYWKSKKPQSVGGGFEFVGQKDASTTLPGTGWSYGRFFTDNNGELYFSARVKAILAKHASGEMGLGLYRYNTCTRSWTALGGEADRIRDGIYYKVILWENGGMAPGGWYQGFLSHIKFDNENRIHLAASINTDTALAGNNRLIYAMSADGGLTWKKANGASIPGLPIRAANGKANLGDVVGEKTVAPFFGSDTGAVADKNGKPGVVVDNVWRNWNGTSWTINTSLNASNVPSAGYGNAAADGTMVLTKTGASTSKFLHTNSFSSLAYGYDVEGFNSFVSVDEHGLRTSGEVYGVGLDPVSKTESVVRTTVTPAPLPCAWMGKDIAPAGTLGYASVSGFSNRTFVVRNYGTVLDNTNDSFHYVSGKFTGDGTIITRVNSTSPSSNSRAGVMMRETLNPDSKHAMMLISPTKGAYFGYRNSTAGGTTNLNVQGITTPYWVKLSRLGNVFTGSISSDGKTWREVGKTTSTLPSTLYVGLASASYHRYGMQTVKFDNFSAPGCLP